LDNIVIKSLAKSYKILYDIYRELSK